jgi:3-oxoacyl-(acyl-carrier-protein) synthase
MHQYLKHLHASKGRRGAPMGVVSTISGTLNFNLSAHYGIEGANIGFVSACASSSHALGYALDEIRLGRQDMIIVVGAEDFTAESLLPFSAMNALSKSDSPTASRPWDRTRDGFVPTGGAAALIVESPEHAKRRGGEVLARMTGWGQSSDGFDKTSSHPEGKGLERAILHALEDAGLDKTGVDIICAHATSTKVGDISEAKAIKKVFESAELVPPTFSPKAITGHGLSMTGAMEAAVSTICLKGGIIPGNPHLFDLDPDCIGLNLPLITTHADPRCVISNSSGFGGSNVCLVFEKVLK